MGGGGGSGIGGLFGSGKQQESKQFKMSREASYGERDSLNRLNGIATGAQPSIGQMQMGYNLDMANRQALALAASQRGASNPALAFRQAQMGNQQMNLEGAQQAAIMGQQEKLQANQMILAQAAAQRGVALNSAGLNQQMQQKTNQQNITTGVNAIAGGGQAMMGGAAHGAVVPGEPNVEGDSEVNDTKPYMLSPGEIVVPRSAAKDEESLKAFVKSIQMDKPIKKESSQDMGKVLAKISELTKKVNKLEK